VAGRKFDLACLLQKPLLPGWVADKSGRPVMYSISSKDKRGHRMLLPLGSINDFSSYKGFGLGMIVEIMAGQLSFADGFADFARSRLGHIFVALNISAFGDASLFKANMDSMLAKVCATKPVDPHARVWYAGLRQSENERERLASGIPLHSSVVKRLEEIASRLGIAYDLA
jgi:L-2-hydroxycarboxylate dehydrogenase (NAD+)